MPHNAKLLHQCDELTHLRECVNDLRREREELRSQIDASDRDGRLEPRKKSKSLATPSPNLMIISRLC